MSNVKPDNIRQNLLHKKSMWESLSPEGRGLTNDTLKSWKNIIDGHKPISLQTITIAMVFNVIFMK
jgi:hypothetical protein